MKTYKEFNEGWFSKRDPKKDKLDDMRDDLSRLAQKSAGKGGWSKGEQEKYNKLWIEYRKLNDGTPPKGPKPSVYYDQFKMSVRGHHDLVQALHKKLGIKD
jgi:hypothetical protein